MIHEINTWGIPLTTGFTAWFKPQEDVTAYELSLLSVLTAAKRTREDTQKTFDLILETAPLIIRHFEMRNNADKKPA